MPPAGAGAGAGAGAVPPPPPCASLFYRTPEERNDAPSLPPVSSLGFRSAYRRIREDETELVRR
jgi:hypothetical protein